MDSALLPEKPSIFYLFFNPNSFRMKGKGGREREKNIDVRDKQWFIAPCMTPNWGATLQPRHLPWPGIEPVTFQSMLQPNEPHWPGH